MKRQLGFISVAAIAVIAFISLTGFFGDKKTPAVKTTSLWVELEKGDADQLKIPIPSFAPLVRRVEGAVLVITSVQDAPPRPRLPPGFEEFFGNPFQRQQPQQSLGSGFIIHPSGYALTNNHVIENAKTIKIKVGESLKDYEAEVVGAEPTYDVALIKIKSDRKDWPVIPLGDSSQSQVGDPALAIGNPLGLDLTVTHGIISARYRREVGLDPTGNSKLFDFMQIDAPINPGNSGGPLLNMSGEAIGINTAMARGNGIGFTIPINLVKQILPQLKEFGKASRSYIGVEVGPLSDEVAKSLGLGEASGALVGRVEPNSPAAKAGIAPGDVITEFGGEAVTDPRALTLKASLSAAGKPVAIKVIRDKKTISLTVTPATRPGEPKGKQGAAPQLKGQTFKLEEMGLSAVTLDDATRKHLNLDKSVEGALVVDVDPDSPAGASGLQADDVIIKINNTVVKNAKQLSDTIGAAPKKSVLHVFLMRENSLRFTTLIKP